MNYNSRAFLLALTSTAALFSASASADLLCVKKRAKVSQGRVALSVAIRAASACPKGFISVVDTSIFSGAKGETGAQGAQGVDGAYRVYGDGSAGDRTIASATTLADTVLQYANFTIPAGVNLFVPSGTVIRASGAVTIAGTLTVNTGGQVSTTFGGLSGSTLVHAFPNMGLSSRQAGFGMFGDATASLYGGHGGSAFTTFALRSFTHLGLYGGGGGAGIGQGGTSGNGGTGGGLVTILARGAISISSGGLLSAVGNIAGACSGGGGGGVVVLASASSVDNAGTINVSAGNGGGSSATCGPGGGGGGGFVQFISPSITSGTVTVAGGTAGAVIGTVTGALRMGGGGGGGSAGTGGSGGQVGTGNPVTAGTSISGTAGATSEVLSDPTSLL